MIKDLVTALHREFRSLNWVIFGVLLVLLPLQAGILYLLYVNFADGIPSAERLPILILIPTSFLLALSIVVLVALYRSRLRFQLLLLQSLALELHDLQAAGDRAAALQNMAATLSATLSFERVVEQALDVCSLALADMGVAQETLVGAVFLYDDSALVPVARRRFLGSDEDKLLYGKSGVIAAALQQAEPTATDNPAQDPELGALSTFADCLTVVCVPLRAGYQLFGVMILGTGTAVRFDDQHYELFMAVADHAVIALQNAQLYQRLEAEKQRLIDADEEARRELARDLHDGPTQSIAAIVMRLSFLRKQLREDPGRAAIELEKLETIARRTSKEIRGMLFTLRPLVLETQGLGAAVRALMTRIGETDDVEMHLSGAENGNLLNETAQGVIFSIIEEALSNTRKHARAETVEVHLWQDGDLFVARISDDGVGFETNEVAHNYSLRGSFGMMNMRERAERIDGTVTIESATGMGTVVTLVVPLDKNGQPLQPVVETAG